MKKLAIAMAGVLLIVAMAFVLLPARVDLEVRTVDDQNSAVSGWLESDRDARLEVGDSAIPLAVRLRVHGLAGEIRAAETLVVRGRISKAGVPLGMFEVHGHDIALAGRWNTVKATVR